MGGGAWTTTASVNFVTTKYAASGVRDLETFATLDTAQIYDSRSLDPMLNPKNVIRECVDSDEHPTTFPVILGLDVTGSMGLATKHCATKLNDIMENLYKKVTDIEFMMMGIGDLSYDRAPIQVTQFESDVRILDQTTKIWFEAGGGGNSFESYTAAWYFGLHNTKLDCWKRNKKGLIITMGDEPLNPYLPGERLGSVLAGDLKYQDVDTNLLYEEATKKFNIYHIAITDHESSFAHYETRIKETWGKLLNEHLLFAKSEDLPTIITNIVEDSMRNDTYTPEIKEENGRIAW